MYPRFTKSIKMQNFVPIFMPVDLSIYCFMVFKSVFDVWKHPLNDALYTADTERE